VNDKTGGAFAFFGPHHFQEPVVAARATTLPFGEGVEKMSNEREEFIKEIRTVRGGKYADTTSVYLDRHWYTVASLATSTPAEIRAVFRRAGFKGDPYSRSLHEWAKRQLPKRKHRLNGNRAA
jgi:hypothetical protein